MVFEHAWHQRVKLYEKVKNSPEVKGVEVNGQEYVMEHELLNIRDEEVRFGGADKRALDEQIYSQDLDKVKVVSADPLFFEQQFIKDSEGQLHN